MKAYPFSYGKHSEIPGWTCVVRPSVLDQMDDKARRCIGEAQSGVEFAADEIRWVRGHDAKRGPVDVVYRQRPSGLTDHVGRAWEYCEGFVIERADSDFRFTAAHFDEAHSAMQPRYAEFLASKTPGNSERAASDLELPLKSSDGKPLKLHGGRIATSSICPPPETVSKVGAISQKTVTSQVAAKRMAKVRQTVPETTEIDLETLHAQASAAHESSKTYRELDPISKGVDKMSYFPFGWWIAGLLLVGSLLMMTTCSLIS